MARKIEKSVTTPKPGDIEVLDPVLTEEVGLITEVGAAIAGFIAGVRAFLVQAKSLEREAAGALEIMERVTLPQSPAADEALQLKIKASNQIARRNDDHWKVICSPVWQFHRLLTGKRDKTTKTAEKAAELGNRLHNQYAENARRAADIENARIRREAEEKARQDRQRELDAIEAQRLQDEAAIDELAEREQVYVAAIVELGEGMGVEAARRAGYKDPAGQARRLANTPKIVEAVVKARQIAAAKQQAKAIAALPLDVEHRTVEANVTRAAGTQDRTTWSVELVDEDALIAAILDGNPMGIPRDLLRISTTKLNGYGRDLHELVNRWPGCVVKKSTKVV